jgi:uncharacterized damage-inducible protein DinB
VEAARSINVARPIGDSYRDHPGKTLPARAAGWIRRLEGEPTPPKNVEEIHAAFEQSIREVEKSLQEMTDQEAKGTWRLMLKEREIFSKPRLSVLRSIMLNHWYHHRGQLSVYLRMLDVPIPVIYGRSADESPFA